MRYDIGERTRTHGDFGTRLYRIWAAMKRRCNNKNCPEYPRYGGAGISYDPNWETYEGFVTGPDPMGTPINLPLIELIIQKGIFQIIADGRTGKHSKTTELTIWLLPKTEFALKQKKLLIF